MFLKNVFSLPLVWKSVAPLREAFFGASLVDALFYFKEGIMKFTKLILCLLAILVLSSCVKVNYEYDTTLQTDAVTEPITERVTDVTEVIPTETETTKKEIEKPFILNKNTKKYHNEDCRYVGFMNEENKVFVTSTHEKLQSQSYKPCAFCQE